MGIGLEYEYVRDLSNDLSRPSPLPLCAEEAEDDPLDLWNIELHDVCSSSKIPQSHKTQKSQNSHDFATRNTPMALGLSIQCPMWVSAPNQNAHIRPFGKPQGPD